MESPPEETVKQFMTRVTKEGDAAVAAAKKEGGDGDGKVNGDASKPASEAESDNQSKKEGEKEAGPEQGEQAGLGEEGGGLQSPGEVGLLLPGAGGAAAAGPGPRDRGGVHQGGPPQAAEAEGGEGEGRRHRGHPLRHQIAHCQPGGRLGRGTRRSV